MNDASRIHCHGSIQIEVFHDAIQAFCSYQGSLVPFVVDLCPRTRAEDCVKTTAILLRNSRLLRSFDLIDPKQHQS
jgi:hypothetical protein